MIPTKTYPLSAIQEPTRPTTEEIRSMIEAADEIESLRAQLAEARVLLATRVEAVRLDEAMDRLAECERERDFQANAHKMAQDALLEQGQQLATVKKERDELLAVVRKAVKLNSFREFNDHIPAMKSALTKSALTHRERSDDNSDRELLEGAAKVVGHEWDDYCEKLGLCYYPNKSRPECASWNPLSDDGDALRLAVKLGIGMFHYDKLKPPYVESVKTICGNRVTFKETYGDPYAATRRAIVRAAAALAKLGADKMGEK